ncbi:hypothetical protein SJ093_18255 [Citrobacter freundii]|uniref:hypothetical protein n=1 Tax=Citrobacter freundii TaxID=546 RepID=UPI000FD9B6D0|nr:hypothetical protein [Citrobacter freundii]HED4020356.1 hypothetical protein [Escherichia coli]MCT4736241.1 hypothetical protein [Citrobacter freundii]MDT7068132.1 hypothetical protein [Citrobacter freundii]MDT7083176.1 hypothetical protein [Citrobacter freundii]MDT7137463.1 hypothetical protein [Citrobacter freundii]
MENIVITDAKKRIDKVVSEYRNSVGKAAFTIRVKDKYRMDFRHMVVYMFILVFSILMYKIMFIPSIVSGFVALIGIMASLTPYYFDKFKEKIWTDDYITEFDLFYLCEHEHLYSIIIDEIKGGNRMTYTWLEKNTNEICNFIKERIEADKLKVLAEKLKKEK